MNHTEELASALTSVHSRRIHKAVPVLRKLAEQKTSERGVAAYSLAILYESGSGVEKSSSEAEKYYILADEAGYEMASYRLGSLAHRRGDVSKALEYYKVGAHENPSSAYWCYRILSDNPILQHEDNENIDYLRMAESQGHVLAKKVSAVAMIKRGRGLSTKFAGVKKLWTILLETRRAVADKDKLKFT